MFSLEPEQLFIGLPITLEENICLVYPLTALEILKMTPSLYNYYLNILTLTQDDIEELYKKKGIKQKELPTPFEYFLISCELNDDFLLDAKKAFFTFTREKVQIMPQNKMIVLGNIKEKRIIDETTFNTFQNILRLQNNLDIEEEPEENENEMQKKFRLRRKELKKAKKKQAQKEFDKDKAIDFYTIIKALITKKIISYDDLGKITSYAIHELIDIFKAEEEYSNQIKFLCAGADPKKLKVDYWIRKTYKD